MKSKSLLLCAALICAVLFLGSCSTVGIRRTSRVKIGRGNGPPPHAPAHGYRHKYREQGVELVYDSGRGVYIVVDLPDHYYCDGRFFRLHNARWEVSLQVSGGWKPVYEDSIPPGLRGKGKAKGKWKKVSRSKKGK
jgi:hypothetical protein